MMLKSFILLFLFPFSVFSCPVCDVIFNKCHLQLSRLEKEKYIHLQNIKYQPKNMLAKDDVESMQYFIKLGESAAYFDILIDILDLEDCLDISED